MAPGRVGEALRAGLVITAHTVAEARRELVLSPALSKACPEPRRRVVEGLSRPVLTGWFGVPAVPLLDCAT